MDDTNLQKFNDFHSINRELKVTMRGGIYPCGYNEKADDVANTASGRLF